MRRRNFVSNDDTLIYEAAGLFAPENVCNVAAFSGFLFVYFLLLIFYSITVAGLSSLPLLKAWLPPVISLSVTRFSGRKPSGRTVLSSMSRGYSLPR